MRLSGTGFRVPIEQSADCPAPARTVQQNDNDETYTGFASNIAVQTDVDLTMTLAWAFLRIAFAPGFWPTLIFDILQPDENGEPSTTLSPLISFGVDILCSVTFYSFVIYDFLFNSIGDPQIWLSWGIEFFKDFVVVVQFGALIGIAWTCFRIADGLRLAQQYYAMVAAIAAGLIPLALGFLLVEGFHLASKSLGMDDAWSTYFYLLILIAIITSIFKTIPQGEVIISNKLTAWGGTLTYYVMKVFRVDIFSLISDYNPVTGIITSGFILLTAVFFMVRFWTHLIAAFS